MACFLEIKIDAKRRLLAVAGADNVLTAKNNSSDVYSSLLTTPSSKISSAPLAEVVSIKTRNRKPSKKNKKSQG